MSTTTDTMKIEDMIMLIPFEQSFKVNLLNQYTTLDSDRRVLVDATIRDLYASIISLKYEQNLQAAISETPSENTAQRDIPTEVMEKTQQEMIQKLPSTDTSSHASLSETRERLKEVLQEKQMPQ